jgi:hypothetical protein
MSVVEPTIMDFGRIVLNLISNYRKVLVRFETPARRTHL